jgi:hypothetical protein
MFCPPSDVSPSFRLVALLSACCPPLGVLPSIRHNASILDVRFHDATSPSTPSCSPLAVLVRRCSFPSIDEDDSVGVAERDGTLDRINEQFSDSDGEDVEMAVVKSESAEVPLAKKVVRRKTSSK